MATIDTAAEGSARCDIHLSEGGDYIIMQVSGDITRELAIQWNLQAHALGRQLNINRYLVDLTRSRNLGSNADGYRLVSQDLPQEESIDPTARVAVLVSPGDNSHNFIEVVARNAGWDFTIFNSYRLARLHLLERR